MKKMILAFGILSIMIYAHYYQGVYEYYSNVEYKFDANNPLYLWGDITNCTIYSLMCFLFIFIGKGEEKAIKIFGYYAVGLFWGLLVLTYFFNYLVTQQVVMHRVGVVFISLFSIAILYLITICCIRFYKSLLQR